MITSYLVFLQLWNQNPKHDWSLNGPPHTVRHSLHLNFISSQPACPFFLGLCWLLWSGLFICPALLRGIFLERRWWQRSLTNEKLCLPDSCLTFKICVYLGIKQRWFILRVSSGPVKPWILLDECIHSKL